MVDELRFGLEVPMTFASSPPVQTDRLETSLLNRSGRQIRNLRVQFENAGLVLHGQATTYYAKQLAQHAATEITGLLVIANEIEVP